MSYSVSDVAPSDDDARNAPSTRAPVWFPCHPYGAKFNIKLGNGDVWFLGAKDIDPLKLGFVPV